MKVEHLGGSIVVDAAGLNRVLELRYGSDANEFWLSASVAKYPLLAILVRGSLASLHYFPTESHPGFISVGGKATSATITFCTNTPSEHIEVASDSVVPFDQARRAAHELMKEPHAMPVSIQWREL